MQPPIKDMPDDTWVNPREVAAAYNIHWVTARGWRDHGKIRGRGRAKTSQYHLGDFREQVAQKRDRDAGRDAKKLAAERAAKRTAMDVAIFELFEQPLTPGECAHVGCETPRDQDSPFAMCPHHDQRAQRPTRHLPTRCTTCQHPISEHSAIHLSGLCRDCAIKASIHNRRPATVNESEHAA